MLNTNLRTDEKGRFEKDCFKLMSNKVFGKTMGNIINHKNMKLWTSPEKYAEHVMTSKF